MSNTDADDLVDLKAELLRKQQEFKAEKLNSRAGHIRTKPITKKSNKWSKQNTGVLARAQQDLEVKQETDDVLSRSKAALEAKARQYEEMSKLDKVSEEDGGKKFLVDFQQKNITGILERKRERERKMDEEKYDAEVKERLKEAVIEPSEEQEQWVDYVDSLGRSRRCLKKDLSELMKTDVKYHTKCGSVQNKSGISVKRDVLSEPHLMSVDMQREIQRQKWEQEEEEELNKPAGPVHYADVQYSENRSHGVAYYKFSKEEEARVKEMETLQKLRKQTEENRSQKDKLKATRKAVLKARLAKVKQRKMIREGKPITDVDLDVNDSSDEDDLFGTKLSDSQKTKEPEVLARDDTWRKEAPVREWDKDKKPEPPVKGYDSWIQGIRSERPTEFAPPAEYYNSAQPPHGVDRQNKEFPTRPAASAKQTQRLRAVEKDVISQLSDLRHQVESQTAGPDAGGGGSLLSGVDTIPLPCMLPRPPENVGSLQANLPYTQPAMSATALESGQHSMDAQYCSSFGGETDERVTHQCRTAEAWQYENTSVESADAHNPVIHHNAKMHYQLAQHMSPTLGEWCDNVSDVITTFTQNWASSMSGVPSHQTLYRIDDPSRNSDSKDVISNTKICCEVSSTNSRVADDVAILSEPHESDVRTKKKEVHPLSAPQPAHIAARPMRPQVRRQPRYEKVNIHELPGSLPAPPTEGSTQHYPSQEEVFDKKTPSTVHRTEENQVRHWQRQFGHQAQRVVGNTNKLKNIPFPAPFVQKKVDEKTSLEKVEYDPTKPPPSASNR